MDNSDLGPAKTFFQFMEAVMASDLTPAQRLILLVQAKHADAHSSSLTRSYPSQETLARETGLSIATIKRERPKLVASGWMVQTHQGRGGNSSKSNEFDLRVPKSKAHHEPLATYAVAESKAHHEPLQQLTMSPCKGSPRALAKAHHEPTSTPTSTPTSAPATATQPPSGEGQDRATGNSLVALTWDGDVSRLVAPPHPEDGPSVYFVRAGGAARPPRGRMQPGEVRAVIDFPELERSGRIGWRARRDSDGQDRAKLGSDDVWTVV